MSKNKNKRKKITTPAGTAQWAWLTKPNTRFNPEGTLGVDLLLDEDVAKPLIDELDQMVEESYQKACEDLKEKKKAGQIKKIVKKEPYQEEYDEEGEPTGQVRLKFTNNAKTKEGKAVTIRLFDAKAKPIKDKAIRVGNGSLIKVSFTPSLYFIPATNMAGVKLYLNAVQILELADVPTDIGNFGFEAEEDYSFDGESLEDTQVEEENDSDFDEEEADF